jgi:glycerol-3-phosphate dehydrogenase (NAD(P)+)
MPTIAVLGAGAWGTALAAALVQSGDTDNTTHLRLWTRNPEHAARMRATRSNDRYLPGATLPAGLALTADLAEATRGADVLIAAVPTSGFRTLLRQLNAINTRTALVWLCKGFEAGSQKLPHQVVAEEWEQPDNTAVLSGPSFAAEIARGLPAALTLAAPDTDFARQIAHTLHRPRLRLYASDDVIGVEVGGAIKNVIAIAAGISDGLGFGYNARAALVTRGLAEMSRLGRAMGGRQETFMGLSGMGDLILTCTGDLSRNRQVGLRLAAGDGLEHILRSLEHVAEGVTTTHEVCALAQRLGVDMPIASAVRRILAQELPAREAVSELLSRELRDEGV